MILGHALFWDLPRDYSDAPCRACKAFAWWRVAGPDKRLNPWVCETCHRPQHPGPIERKSVACPVASGNGPSSHPDDGVRPSAQVRAALKPEVPGAIGNEAARGEPGRSQPQEEQLELF